MADSRGEFSKLFETVGSSGEIQFRIPQTLEEEDDNMSIVSSSSGSEEKSKRLLLENSQVKADNQDLMVENEKLKNEE